MELDVARVQSSAPRSWILVLAGLLVCATGLGAQPLDLDTPPDSPLWWTLTDELTPAQLRAEYRDKSRHVERFLAAAEAGLAPPIQPEQVEALTFYYNRVQNPELTPMWLAFVVFGSAHLMWDGEAVIRERLTKFGISPAGVEQILRLTTEEYQEERELFAEVREAALEFQALQREILASGEKKVALKEALKKRDLAFFSRFNGRSQAEIEKLYTAWKTSPPADVGGEYLVRLKRELSPSDWQTFRRFLLQEVVSQMGSSIDFDYSQGESQ